MDTIDPLARGPFHPDRKLIDGTGSAPPSAEAPSLNGESGGPACYAWSASGRLLRHRSPARCVGLRSAAARRHAGPAVLLPAAMKVLGNRNWYLPRWLDWLPEISRTGLARSAPSRSRAATPVASEPNVPPVTLTKG